jgi:hypothetical protein
MDLVIYVVKKRSSTPRTLPHGCAKAQANSRWLPNANAWFNPIVIHTGFMTDIVANVTISDKLLQFPPSNVLFHLSSIFITRDWYSEALRGAVPNI